jgi:hypothetical protein
VLYPNPTSSLVTVGGVECQQITLIDSRGVTILKVQGTNTIDVSDIVPNEYLLQIKTVDNNVITKSVLVK